MNVPYLTFKYISEFKGSVQIVQKHDNAGLKKISLRAVFSFSASQRELKLRLRKGLNCFNQQGHLWWQGNFPLYLQDVRWARLTENPREYSPLSHQGIFWAETTRTQLPSNTRGFQQTAKSTFLLYQ